MLSDWSKISFFTDKRSQNCKKTSKNPERGQEELKLTQHTDIQSELRNPILSTMVQISLYWAKIISQKSQNGPL